MKPNTTNTTEATILQHLDEQNTIFVFPTGLAATAWAERMLEHVEAVAMDRFIAWDSFKSEAIRTRHQQKASIPATMRKIFASSLIQENAAAVAAGNQPLFAQLINPTYAAEAQSFTNWLAGLLPSLETWRRNLEKAALVPDQQDEDLLYLHRRYAEFLAANNRFDPAWEQPPFEDDGFHYLIFYPEVLTDFSEYRHILESSSHITLISSSDDTQGKSPDCIHEDSAPDCILYSNARQELRETALFIRNLVAAGNTAYSDIFVSVPDMETIGPYLRRELELYAIPAVLRSGKTLSAYGAGAVFAQIRTCLSADFSFASLKDLLLNRHLPWKEAELNQKLIQFGIDNNCICSYTDGDTSIDLWLQAFKKNPGEERLRSFYARLQQEAKKFSRADSFEKLREAYFQFRDTFWDMGAVGEESDLILGRCLTELAALVDLEREFPQLPVPSPFNFFLQVLEEKEYLAQTRERGVNVVPYRLASSAPAFCHIVVGASQKDITLVFQQLGFLSAAKRRRLQLTDTDPSEAFIRLYQVHSRQPVRFSVAEKSFSGYSIPHNALNPVRREDLSLAAATGEPSSTGEPSGHDICRDDFIMQEERLFSKAQRDAAEIPAGFHPTAIQQEGFRYWQRSLAARPNQPNSADSKFEFPHWKKKIIQALRVPAAGNRNPPDTKLHNPTDSVDSAAEKLRISPTHLNEFFTCPRSWYFSKILRLDEPDTETQLMRNVWMGTIYHDIIRQYLEPLQRCGTPLIPPTTDEFGLLKLVPEEAARLEAAVEAVLSRQEAVSPISQELLLAQKDNIAATAKNFIVSLCSLFPDHQVVALEEEITCPADRLETEFQASSELQDFVLLGRFDCILNSPDDSLVLLDFKLSSTPKQKESTVDEEGGLKNFQMALYTLLYEAVHPQRTIDSAAFLSIKSGEPTKIFGFGDKKLPQRNHEVLGDGDSGKPPFDRTLAACRTYIAEFARSLGTCSFPQMGAVTDETCTSCSWKRICRTVYTVGGDKK